MKATSSLHAVKVPAIALPPAEGKVAAADAHYHTNAFTGGAELSIPIPLPAARALTPSLAISYGIASGNGTLGMGFHLGESNITIKTNRAYPRYNNEDIYTLDGAELVFSATTTRTQNGEQVTVDTFLERFQSSFSLIRRFCSRQHIYWEVTLNDNSTIVYGDTTASRIADPEDATHIFTWYAAKHTDATGNMISYTYGKLDPDDANIYLTNISYGNYHRAGGEDAFAFKVWVDYGQLDVKITATGMQYSDNSLQPAKRPDNIWSYRSGFAIRTQFLIKHILVVHDFPEEQTAGKDCITTVMQITYNEVKDAAACTTLRSVTEYGAVRIDPDNYRLKALPPVWFDFTTLGNQPLSFLPVKDNEGAVFNQQLHLVDLHREGFPGILYRNADTLYFYAASGNGVYEIPSFSMTAPNRYADPAMPLRIVSMEGNGELQLELSDDQCSGYYALDDQQQWQPFTTFQYISLNNVAGYTASVDLSGANRLDELLVTPQDLFYRASQGLQGMSTAVTQLKNVHGVAAEQMPDPYVYYGFENIFGDGMQHRISIAGDTLTVWPCLGYGHFAAPVTQQLPVTARHNIDLQQRLLLADVSGSGTTDIIYVFADSIEVCFNHGGLSFSAPQVFPFQNGLEWTDADQIRFTDVAGKGNVCMVLSKGSPHTYDGVFHEVAHYYCEFNAHPDNYCYKPFLLKTIADNGSATTIRYKSSLQYLLADKASDPWYTKLPFPVIVVAEEEMTDQITNTSYSVEYSYRDGYYDPVSHSFFGFGCTTEKSITTDTPGVYTKTWFHLGNGLDEAKMRTQFFNNGKDYTSIAACITSADDLTVLNGEILHEEKYGQDDMRCPFTAGSSTWQVICTQAATNDHQAVYRSYDCQTVSFDYERRENDPLIHHNIILLADEFTNVICSADLTYPRRQPLIPGQAMQYCTGNAYTLQNQTSPELPRRIGVPLAIQSFEITGLKSAAAGLYTFEELQAQLVDKKGFLNQLPPAGQPGDSLAARLLSWDQQYYWADEQQQAVWQQGMALPAILLTQYTATLSFDNNDVTNMLQGQVKPAELTNAGYMEDKDGYWWTRSSRAYYEPLASFCMLKQLQFDWVDTTDPLYTSTQISFDNYYLNIIDSSQWLNKDISLTTRADIDYRVMHPWRVTDINGNYGEALFDELGTVIATAAIDKSGVSGDASVKEFKSLPVTDIGDVMHHPLKYLQGAGSFIHYQFATLLNGQWQPGFTLELTRTVYKSTSDITVHRSISYSDGFGRQLETRIYNGGTEAMWRVSDHVVYNTAGEVREQYLGYFANTWQYEQDWESRSRATLPAPARFTYDATGRIMTTLTPKGFITATQILNAWETRHYDENDTILESPYYKGDTWNNDPQEKDAIEKAVACYNTPDTTVADARGNIIFSIADNATGKTTPINWELQALSAADIDAKDPTLEVSHQSFDILRRVLKQQDARFTEQGTGNNNFVHTYPIANGLFYTQSSDSNITYGYTNVHGAPVSQWNALGIRHTVAYDNLQRPVHIKVQTPEGYSPAVNQITEVNVYGETHPAGISANMLGKVWKHYNDGGIAYADAFTFDQHPVSEHFRYRKDYKNEADWQLLADDLLEAEIFTAVNTYDAAGKLIASIAPDGTASNWSYSPLGFCLQSGMQVQGKGNVQPVLTAVQVDANGLLTRIAYANGINTTQQYDPLTLAVAGIKCMRSGMLLQEIDLWHDPAGNISSAINSQEKSIFFNNQQVNPVFSWTYDSCYRLRNATGRLQLKRGSQASLENYTESYQYDKSDNLTQLRRTATNGFTRKFTVDDKSNRTTSMTVGQENYKIGYNAVGYMNSTGENGTGTLSWNTSGDIANAAFVVRQDSPADMEYYVYSNGIRVRKITEKYDDAGKLISLTDKRYLGTYRRKTATTGDTMHSVSIGGAGQHDCLVQYFTSPISGIITKPAIYRFQQTESITIFSMETNLEGGLISYEEYTPFGETVYSYDPADLESTREYRYSQQEKDEFTGLYYYGYRYYAPWLCRWTRPDPAGKVDGPNLYAFVRNNPVGNIDVLGLVRRKKKGNGWSTPRRVTRKTPSKTTSGVRKKLTPAEKAARAKKRQENIEAKDKKFARRPAVSPRFKIKEAEEAAKNKRMIARLKGFKKLAVRVTEAEIEKTDNSDFDALIRNKLTAFAEAGKKLDLSQEKKTLATQIDFSKEFESKYERVDNKSGLKISKAYGRIYHTADVQAVRGKIDHLIPINLNTRIHDRGHLIWQSANKHADVDSDKNLIAENAKVNQFAKTAWERRVNNLALKYGEVHHLSLPRWDDDNDVKGVYHFSFVNRQFHEGIYLANPQRVLLYHR